MFEKSETCHVKMKIIKWSVWQHLYYFCTKWNFLLSRYFTSQNYSFLRRPSGKHCSRSCNINALFSCKIWNMFSLKMTKHIHFVIQISTFYYKTVIQGKYKLKFWLTCLSGLLLLMTRSYSNAGPRNVWRKTLSKHFIIQSLPARSQNMV